MREFVPKNVKLIPDNAEMVFRGKIFDVYQWPQEMFDGTTETFEMLKRADTVEIIAIKDDKIIITRQKQPRKDWYYAFPGGRTDMRDENELMAAKRELREETGMEFRNWKLIKAVQPFAKVDWLVYTFLATDFIQQGKQELDAGEVIEIKEVSFAEMVKLTKEPNARDLKVDWDGLGEVKSLDELKNLPAIHDY